MLIIDNTKQVWADVRDALETIQPKKIAVNVCPFPCPEDPGLYDDRSMMIWLSRTVL